MSADSSPPKALAGQTATDAQSRLVALAEARHHVEAAYHESRMGAEGAGVRLAAAGREALRLIQRDWSLLSWCRQQHGISWELSVNRWPEIEAWVADRDPAKWGRVGVPIRDLHSTWEPSDAAGGPEAHNPWIVEVERWAERAALEAQQAAEAAKGGSFHWRAAAGQVAVILGPIFGAATVADLLGVGRLYA